KHPVLRLGKRRLDPAQLHRVEEPVGGLGGVDELLRAGAGTEEQQRPEDRRPERSEVAQRSSRSRRAGHPPRRGLSASTPIGQPCRLASTSSAFWNSAAVCHL